MIHNSAEEVLNKYTDMVYRLAYARTKNKYDADDIFQDVFLKYVKSAPEFTNEEHQKAWLIRVTINCSKSLFNSSWFKKRVSMEDKDVRDMEVTEDNIDEGNDVYTAVMQLPLKYRTAIHLYYYEDYSIIEISSILSSKESTVKSWLRRGRNMLEEILKEVDFDYEI